jgi:hypothetical protein
MGQLAGMAGNDGLVGLITFTLRDDLVKNGDDKYCGLTHARLSLAENVLSLEGQWDGLDLHLTRMLKAALSDGALEFVLKEELVPTSKVGTLVLLGEVLLRLLLIGALILGHYVSHVLYF